MVLATGFKFRTDLLETIVINQSRPRERYRSPTRHRRLRVLIQGSHSPATSYIALLTPLQVKCTQCNEVHPKTIGINRQDEYEVAGGRGGMANFVWNCGFCRREASARFEPSSPTKPYSAENGQFAPFVTLDCRNLEFVDFDPKVCQPLN